MTWYDSLFNLIKIILMIFVLGSCLWILVTWIMNSAMGDGSLTLMEISRNYINYWVNIFNSLRTK
ncbi:MAG: hypothetical protein P9X22_07210 [Candidatus Zapsychrus exili]|nr:hypothetical protein [Candidatus Zapsychrus exili]